MTNTRNKQDEYLAIVKEKGPLKTLLKAVKSEAGEGRIDRIFITGVFPVVMSDITSGFIVAEDVFYLETEFNDLCGFTENEVRKTLERIDKGRPGGNLDSLVRRFTFASVNETSSSRLSSHQ